MPIVQQVSFLVFLISSFLVICFLFSFGFTIASVLHTFDDKETIPFCNRKFVAIYSILDSVSIQIILELLTIASSNLLLKNHNALALLWWK